MKREQAMKSVTMMALVLALGGCSTVREGMGMVQRAAEDGIGIRSTAQTDQIEPQAADDSGSRLPGGLVGDTQNRRYTTDPVPSN